ncbi:MAG: TetR/AcrR family transcriptional regulator [Planctomycetaceae bacterium]|nr:TetR/AcrR family transcriptional regulator [Planctomycetaceae bacterium]
MAKPILIAEGFQALTMDRLASRMEYAKGTIYNHFPNKEEIVLALAIEAMKLRHKLFDQASTGDRPARIRLMTIGVACEFYTQRCTEEFQVEQWMRNANIWDKSSSERQRIIRECEAGCMQVVARLVRESLAQGELLALDHLTPEEMVFGLWAITFGSQILTASSPSLQALGVFDPIRTIRIHCCRLLNGFGWQPIQSEKEYLKLVEEISAEYFPQFEQIQREHR